VVIDIPPHAAKTGALGNQAVIEAVAAAAEKFAFPLVVDPIMISKNGTALMDQDARRVLAELLVPRAFLLTPNLHEAAVLTGSVVDDLASMGRAAEKLVSLGAKNVLVKGGHLEGDAVDVLFTQEGTVHEYPTPRIDTTHTHGTGCTYSAAITAELAKGVALRRAVAIAKEFVTNAIRENPGLGSGSGPLNHHA
jgi:hydroxymethylpyrimidine/phosphomethylpyrimidine kinase